jgi:hypothetical protein
MAYSTDATSTQPVSVKVLLCMAPVDTDCQPQLVAPLASARVLILRPERRQRLSRTGAHCAGDALDGGERQVCDGCDETPRQARAARGDLRAQ